LYSGLYREEDRGFFFSFWNHSGVRPEAIQQKFFSFFSFFLRQVFFGVYAPDTFLNLSDAETSAFDYIFDSSLSFFLDLDDDLFGK
jgi:hypothetical protein